MRDCRPAAPGVAVRGRLSRRVARSQRAREHCSHCFRRRGKRARCGVGRTSRSRFLHLFTTSVGVPMRPYVLWLRLQCGAREFARGKSVAEAAHALRRRALYAHLPSNDWSHPTSGPSTGVSRPRLLSEGLSTNLASAGCSGHLDPRLQDLHRSVRVIATFTLVSRNRRISPAMTSWSSSSAKCPVSRR